MNNLFQRLLSAFDTHTQGFSARKLTAFVITACVVAIHIKYILLGDLTNMEGVLMIDYGFISLCLGMTTYEAITNKKIDKNPQ